MLSQVGIVDLDQRIREPQRQLERIHDAALNSLFNHQTVHDHVDRMLALFIQNDIFIQISHHIIHHYAHKAFIA